MEKDRRDVGAALVALVRTVLYMYYDGSIQVWAFMWHTWVALHTSDLLGPVWRSWRGTHEMRRRGAEVAWPCGFWMAFTVGVAVLLCAASMQ
jgi:hypothetical protein